jgi:sec-independent protein translocase protein TatB
VFGIGWSEFVVIALVTLIFVGPKHLPVVLRKVGAVIGELKRASIELQSRVSEEVRDIERSMGDVKSPKAILKDLEQDIRENLKDPYDEIGKDIRGSFKDPYAEVRETEQTYQAEIEGIKTKIESTDLSEPNPVNDDESPIASSTGSQVIDKNKGQDGK